jgi:preprotein translocase subunit SecG
MFVLFSIIIILACVFLTLVVLIQNPKGGGIASNFTAPNQIMGARRSTDVVEKTTWILAIVLISFSLLSNFFRPIGQSEESGVKDSRIKGQIEEAQVPNAAPTPAPAPAPDQNQQTTDPNAPAGEPQTQPQQP